MENWFNKLFVNEAKAALNSKSSPSSDQVESAVNKYLDEHPVESATATVVDNVLTVT